MFVAMFDDPQTDRANTALGWIEGCLTHLDALDITDDQIAAAAAAGWRWGSDPDDQWVQLDYAEGLATRLHARMASLSAAFARERLRCLSPSERDELPAHYLRDLVAHSTDQPDSNRSA